MMWEPLEELDAALESMRLALKALKREERHDLAEALEKHIAAVEQIKESWAAALAEEWDEMADAMAEELEHPEPPEAFDEWVETLAGDERPWEPPFDGFADGGDHGA